MPTQEVAPWRAEYAFARYVPSLEQLAEGIIIDGRNFIAKGEPPVPTVYNGIGGAVFAHGQNDTFSVGPLWGSIDKGGAILWKNLSLWYDGFGNFYYDDQLIGSPGGALRIRLSAGGVIGAGADYAAGLAAPTTAATLAIGAAVSQKMRGSYGLEYTYVRRSTGAESNASPPADITLNKKKMAATIPAIPGGQGIDAINLYGTPRGLGTVGPFESIPKYNPVLVPFANPLQLEWNDNELGPTFAPIANDPPPPVTGYGFVVAFGDKIIVLCTYGGAGLSPSGDGPEDFDPLDTLFAQPFEQINGCWPRNADGFALYSTGNSLQSLYPSGGRHAVAIRTLWGEDGIPGGTKSGCFARGRFFCYTQSGPAMYSGETTPDDSFANDVKHIMRAYFTPDQVVVAYDPFNKCVLFCDKIGGENVAIPMSLLTGQWQTPITLPAHATAAVTYGGLCHLVFGGPGRGFDVPGGTIYGTPYMRSGFQQGIVRSGYSQPERGSRFDITRGILQANAAMTSRIYGAAEGDTPPAFASPVTGPAGGNGWTPVLLPHRIAAAVEVFGSVAGDHLNQYILEGYTDPRRYR